MKKILIRCIIALTIILLMGKCITIVKFNNNLNFMKQEMEETVNVNSELIDVTPIEDTPFMVVRHDETYFLALGKYRLTEPMKDKDSVISYAKDTSWAIIMSIMKIVCIEHDAEKEKKEEIKKSNLMN